MFHFKFNWFVDLHSRFTSCLKAVNKASCGIWVRSHDSFGWLYSKLAIRRQSPFISYFIVKRILKFQVFFLLEFFVILSDVKLDLIAGNSQSRKGTNSWDDHFEKMTSVENILKNMLEWAFDQRFKNNRKATMRLPWQNLSVLRSLVEALVRSFHFDWDRFLVEVTDVEIFFLSRTQENSSHIDDHRPNCNISQLQRG